MIENEISLPLVAVVVVTYNSSKFVLETLESIKSQTYRNIELIITDDCSKDDTGEICRKWLDENKGRFVNAKLIVAQKNTGISGNCNRGLSAVNAEWVKIIAGDDILESFALSEYITFVLTDSSIKFVSCQVTVFSDDEKKCGLISSQYEVFDAPIQRQFKYLLTTGNFIVGASMFFNVDIARKIGGFDERFPMLDDYPFFVKVYKEGYRFYLLKKPLVRYRVHGNNASLSNNSLFADSSSRFYDAVIPALLLQNRLFLHYWDSKIIVFKKRFPKDKGIMNKIIRITLSLFSPIYYYNNLIRLFDRNYSQKS
ncbi:MAG: glycosyltransferase [Chlorobiaceae bacterium]|nr:glycosyltransferase [Chlorobiaceae bacterium]